MSTLVVAALPQELGSSFDGVPVLYTGVGKVNASIALSTHLAIDQEHDGVIRRVINFGTAGSVRHPIGRLVHCNQFKQGDMNCTALGCDQNVTPFDDAPTTIEFKKTNLGLDSGLCVTFDRFIAGDFGIINVVHDMEGYALAKVCLKFGVEFVCIKYVSDSGNPKDWESNCKLAGSKFRDVYDRIMNGH